MSTTDTPAPEATTPLCEACRRRPVQSPGKVAYVHHPGSPSHGKPYTPSSARFCGDCLDRCGNSEDVYHRCPVCHDYSKPEPPQPPDTSIEDRECQCSLVERCAMCRAAGATTSAYNDGINPACGCLSTSQCASCRVCTSCDGCYCNED